MRKAPQPHFHHHARWWISMEKGERAHKALFVSSISFGQNKCSMKFLKNYTWIRRCEIAMCIFQNGWAWRGWCTRHLPIAYFWRHWRALIIESWLSYFSCWKDGHNSIPIFEPFLGFRSPKSEDWISEGKNVVKNSSRVIFGLPKSLSYLLLSLFV